MKLRISRRRSAAGRAVASLVGGLLFLAGGADAELNDWGLVDK